MGESLTRAFYPLLLAVTLGVPLAGNAAAEDDVSVSITPATAKIRACDPLFVKVSVRNQSTRRVEIAPELSCETGTLQFQVRPAGQGEFQNLDVNGQGEVGLSAARPTAVEPSQKCVSYGVLFARARKNSWPSFAEPGRFEVRAVVATGTAAAGTKRLWTSESVKIDVGEIPETQLRAVESSKDWLGGFITTQSVNVLTDEDNISALCEILSDCELKTTLQWLGAVRAVMRADIGGKRDVVLEAFAQKRKRLSPVIAEIATLVLAETALKNEDWSILQKQLEEIREDSPQHKKLRLQLEIHRDDLARKGGVQ